MSLLSLITGNFKKIDDRDCIFIENAAYEKGFANHYDQHIKPHIAYFENKRMKTLHKANMRTRISVVICILSIIMTFSIFNILPEDSDAGSYAIGFSILAIIISLFWISHSITRYHNLIKSEIFPKILSFFGNYHYLPKCGDMVKKYEESGIVPFHNREYSEDRINGEYKGVTIDLFKTTLQKEERDSEGDSRYVTVFSGIFVLLNMHKPFQGKTMVAKYWISGKHNKVKIRPVKLEDPVFNKKFRVSSSDQVEARYLLTTSFMERLIELENAFKGYGLQCSFYNHHLLLTIPVTQNLFQPGSIFEPEDFIDDTKMLLKDMHSIFQIVDILKLNEKTGL